VGVISLKSGTKLTPTRRGKRFFGRRKIVPAPTSPLKGEEVMRAIPNTCGFGTALNHSFKPWA
jgi:hypothetical protein